MSLEALAKVVHYAGEGNDQVLDLVPQQRCVSHIQSRQLARYLGQVAVDRLAEAAHGSVIEHLKSGELLASHCPALGSPDVDASDDKLIAAVSQYIVQIERGRTSLADHMHSVGCRSLELLLQLVVQTLSVCQLLESG